MPKGPGYEYWSRRPTSRNWGSTPGRFTKTRTHRIERQEAKKIIQDEFEHPSWGEVEWYERNEFDYEALEDAVWGFFHDCAEEFERFETEYEWVREFFWDPYSRTPIGCYLDSRRES